MPRTSKPPAKAKYSALFVGWQEIHYPVPTTDSGFDALIRDVLATQPPDVPLTSLPRLVLGLSRKGLKVVQQSAPATGGRRRTRQETTTRHEFRDILHAAQGVDPDVRSGVACVIYGYNQVTTGWVHVCVYWFDEGPQVAERFRRHLSHFVDSPEHRTWVGHVEADMLAKGQIRPRPAESELWPMMDDGGTAGILGATAASDYPAVQLNGNGNYANGLAAQHQQQSSAMSAAADRADGNYYPARFGQGPCGAVWVADDQLHDGMHRLEIDAENKGVDGRLPAAKSTEIDDLPPDYDDVDDDDEFEAGRRPSPSIVVPHPVASLAGELKSKFGRGAPILLPPKDYDTVNRTRGNLLGIESRRCLNEVIVGVSTSSATSQDGAQSDGSSREDLFLF